MRVKKAHGSGGAETSSLIAELFLEAFGDRSLGQLEDATVVPVNSGRIAVTTDSFVVTPLEFPGGDIGRLAVCGTVNDLSMVGAVPRWLTAGFILEEGLESETLGRVARSMAEAAREAGVYIAAGDTKVVEGNGGMFINTSGVGEVVGPPISISGAKPGDALLLSGTLGDHHACILSARMDIRNSIISDVSPLDGCVSALRDAGIDIHAMRDVTRGGLATILCELAQASACRAVAEEKSLPVAAEVAGLCGVLGLDPLYMGNEGKMVLAVPREQAGSAVEILWRTKCGKKACVVGHIEAGSGAVLHTAVGGTRALHPLIGEGLPRIC